MAKVKGPTLVRQDPGKLRAFVEFHLKNLGCDRLVRKRWQVPRARVEKGLKARIGVGALVWGPKHFSKVLLVRHHPRTGWDPEKWFTPGGVLEEGETPEKAMMREILEEVGLEVEVLALSQVNVELLVHGKLEAETYFFQFEARSRGGDPSPRPGEIREVKWFDALPVEMAFRDDYVEYFNARKGCR